MIIAHPLRLGSTNYRAGEVDRLDERVASSSAQLHSAGRRDGGRLDPLGALRVSACGARRVGRDRRRRWGDRWGRTRYGRLREQTEWPALYARARHRRKTREKWRCVSPAAWHSLKQKPSFSSISYYHSFWFLTCIQYSITSAFFWSFFWSFVARNTLLICCF